MADPVTFGIVKSLAHPGGNITGFHNYEPALGGKWLEALARPDINTKTAQAIDLKMPEALLVRGR